MAKRSPRLRVRAVVVPLVSMLVAASSKAYAKAKKGIIEKSPV